jgi:hypothetical protein
MLKKFVFAIILIIFHNAYSQDEQKFFVGVNVGVKFANKNYATRYSGIYPVSGNQGYLETVINQTNNYQQIYTLLGEKTFQVPFDSYPTNIKYSPGLLTGVTLGYKLSPNLQIGIDADFSKLKIRDFFSLQVDDPSNQTSQAQYQLGNLYGEESRFNGRFNFDYIIEGETVNFIVGASGLFSAWRIDEHFAVFNDYRMPLFSKHNPNNNFSIRTGGSGWGGGLNVGVEYRIKDNLVGQLMYQPYVQRVDYLNTKSQIAAFGSSYIPDRFRLEHDITLRILWK